MKIATEDQWVQASDLVDPGQLPLQSDGEVWVVLDAEANKEDPDEALIDYRFWRSAAGRQRYIDDTLEGGRPLGDHDR